MTKGVLLAGGKGTRLLPMTRVVNKHLLPCYDRPMVYYPLQKLIDAGCKDIMIITSDEHAGDFISLLGDGDLWGVNFTYRVQLKASGIAGALALAKDFVGEDNVLVILGDNYHADKIALPDNFSGAQVWLKTVPDPKRFGVATIGHGDNVIEIIEKPEEPVSNLAVTGIYLYDKEVWKILEHLKPSDRGELEITDVNNAYIEGDKMKAVTLEGHWQDLGTVESLYSGSIKAKEQSHLWRQDVLER